MITGYSQNVDSLLTALYFNNGARVLDSNGFNFDSSFTSSPTYWAVDSFSENVVFNAELSYNNPLDSSESYQIRIGKGGQLYSFRSAFGESVPPQFRPAAWAKPSYGGGTSYAPWVDEVWQIVCVDGSLNNPPDSAYFIHQAGVYLKTPNQNQPFYSPKVAEYYNPDKMSYSTVNWGQQAHTEDIKNSGHTSSLLYYTSYTNKGHGIVQVDNMIYNFGQDNISFLNMPWGGVRNSNLDNFFISTPTNNYNISPGLYGNTPVVKTASTGGWVAWSNDTMGNAPTLGMVHPVTTNTKNNVFRYGDAGNLSAAWNKRDYHVFEMIRFPAFGQLGFGKSMSFRYFYVLGATVDSVKNIIITENLVSKALDTAYIPAANSVDSVRYLFQQSLNTITENISNGNSGLMLRTSPYLNSYPLFKITGVMNNDVISSDPYFFSEDAYDGSTIATKLLGFLEKPTNISILNDTICAGENYLFPDNSLQLRLYNDTVHMSIIRSKQSGWDSLIITNLTINDSKIPTDSIVSCNSYTWINGVTYIASDAAAKDTFKTINGCDSIVSLNLTINYSKSFIDTIVACNSYTWVNGVTYTSSDTSVKDTFKTINGCDSVVSLNLTINYSKSLIDSIVSCNSYTWINGVTYTSGNTAAKDTFKTINGCDSVVSLNLSINSIDKSVYNSRDTLISLATNAKYQWLDCENLYNRILGATNQIYVAADGNYALEITVGSCVDTTICYPIANTNIIQNGFGNKLLVYPNPSAGDFYVDLGLNYKSISVSITDLNGNRIQHKTYKNKQLIELKLDESAGIYLLVIESDSKKAVLRLVKE
jgi:hypothetical protein